MDARATEHALRAEGFVPIGRVGFRLTIDLWWHAGHIQQLVTLPSGAGILLKGSKTYYLVSVSEEGETWARDIGPLHDYLEAHFPEIHLSFSHFRDLSVGLARRHAEQRLARHPSAAADRAGLIREITDRTGRLAGAERLLGLAEDGSGLLGHHLRSIIDQQRGELTQCRGSLADANASATAAVHLQEDYLRKGSACCLAFTINSNTQVARSSAELQAAVQTAVTELRDAHRFQVTQKLGGKLNIRIAEAREPAMTWLEQWLGGPFAPRQVERVNESPGRSAAETLSEQLMVTPNEDIRLDGSVVEQAKRLAPRAVSAILGRVDRAERIQRVLPDPSAGPTISVGLQMVDERVADQPFEPALSQIVHATISGATGSGKSILLRVMAEEAAGHDEVGVLVLDPRNQAAGMLVPEDRQDLLRRYTAFGLSGPRGFPFSYFAPALPGVPSLPEDLGDLVEGRSIVSFKGLGDAERCDLFARVLDAVFERRSAQEVTGVRLVVLVEEAQLFTRRLAGDRAKPAAARAETALDRILREGRKYGVCAVTSSQSVMDFTRDAASIRQNAKTKVFMHNSDREIEYARDYLDDPRVIVRLRPGEALFCNPAWGVVKVAVRPPRSKVWDLSDSETVVLLRGMSASAKQTSPDALGLLEIIRALRQQTGEPPNVTQAGQAAGVTSRRRLQGLLRELVDAGRVRTRRLRDQGQPRVIEAIDRNEPCGTESGHKADTTGQEVADHGQPNR